MSALILTCNAGSTNTKLAAFDAEARTRVAHAHTHTLAETEAWLCSAGALGEVQKVVHRVVHGGLEFTLPTALSAGVQARLHALVSLAPLHQPAALNLVEVAEKLFPHAAHIACFDTAFHHTLPEVERRFALPRRLHDAGVQRYGFHGLSYAYVAAHLPSVMAEGRVIVAHLGGGASACALRNRQSVATTMGFSTLDGLMMGTRCGALDAGVVLHLLGQGNNAEEISALLYKQSGLRGVSGISGDMQTLLQSDAPEAREAVELFCYMAARQITGLLPALGGLDTLVFTGGIGEHAAPVRVRIAEHLHFLPPFVVHVAPTDEEAWMAEIC